MHANSSRSYFKNTFMLKIFNSLLLKVTSCDILHVTLSVIPSVSFHAGRWGMMHFNEAGPVVQKWILTPPILDNFLRPKLKAWCDRKAYPAAETAIFAGTTHHKFLRYLNAQSSGSLKHAASRKRCQHILPCWLGLQILSMAELSVLQTSSS